MILLILLLLINYNDIHNHDDNNNYYDNDNISNNHNSDNIYKYFLSTISTMPKLQVSKLIYNNNVVYSYANYIANI